MLDFIATVILIYLAPRWWSGITVKNATTAIFVALAIGFLNIFMKPFLILVTLPVTVLTLGLFILVINGFIIWLVSGWFSGFKIKGFRDALVLAFAIAILQIIIP